MAKYDQGMITSNEANGIQLLYDGYGLAVIGEPAAVENFLASEGLQSLSRLLPKVGAMIDGLGTLQEVASSVVETVSTLKDSATSIADSVSSIVDSANSVTDSIGSMAETVGKWIKTSNEIFKIVEKYRLSEAKTPGVLQSVLGQIEGLKGVAPTVKTAASSNVSPAAVAGPAGVMAQMAMQQAIAEIMDYLERIDQKLDDVLRNQKNDVLSRMDGVRLAIQEATSIRDSVGRVSEITWSKIQNTSGKILETQGYALRQISDLADKIEHEQTVGGLAKIFDSAVPFESQVKLWVRVIADCFQLHDSIAVLELDRVLDASPVELDRHRLGMRAARQERLNTISKATSLLINRMNEAAGTANSKVLLNPLQSKAIVKSTNNAAIEIHEFHTLLGVEAGLEESELRAWKDAASETLDKTRAVAAKEIELSRELLGDLQNQAQSMKGKLSGKISDRIPRKKE